MSVIIFLIILSVLVIVHELGHFLAARSFGIRVDEFGLGYPPRAKKLFRWKGADFTLNWLPFGGFVKIFGENPNEENSDATESFQKKNRGIQATVLFAGVFFNFLFAWLLISFGLMTGLPAPAGLSLPLENPQTVITLVLAGSPAEAAGLKSGDTILSINGTTFSPQEASNFIAESNSPINFQIKRGNNVTTRVVTPEEGIVSDRPAVGIAMETIGTVSLPVHRAFIKGLELAWDLTALTGKALGTFIVQAVGGRADLSAVTGPVGIVGIVGEVTELGWGHLLTFTALISINLCLINLLPFPALDGGRLLFVGIETITRRAIPAKLFNAVNAAGFALLIFLMILITIRDVRNIL